MSVESFDSMEEMMGAIRANILRANEHVEPWQEAISFGQDFLVYEPDWKLWAFCHVQTEKEMWENYDGSKEELAFEQEQVAQGVKDGFRFCKDYSVISVDGELEDCHVLKAFCLLTPEEFAYAKGQNWSMEKILEGEDPLAISIKKSLTDRLLALRRNRQQLASLSELFG